MALEEGGRGQRSSPGRGHRPSCGCLPHLRCRDRREGGSQPYNRGSWRSAGQQGSQTEHGNPVAIRVNHCSSHRSHNDLHCLANSCSVLHREEWLAASWEEGLRVARGGGCELYDEVLQRQWPRLLRHIHSILPSRLIRKHDDIT